MTRPAVTLAIVAAAMLVAGCVGGFPTSPSPLATSTAPAVTVPTTTPAPAVTDMKYSLSGVVSEMTADGMRPVAGVRIEAFSCDPTAGNCRRYVDDVVFTADDGSYRFAGLFTGRDNALWVTKDGYDVDGRPLSGCDGCDVALSIDGDTRRDILLIRR